MLCACDAAAPLPAPLPPTGPLSSTWHDLLQRFEPLAQDADPPPGGLPFGAALYGFVKPAWAALRRCAPTSSCYAIDWVAIEHDAMAHLGAVLHQLCRRTLVLELNVARLRELLPGNTPEQRFQYYTRTFLQDPSAWVALGAEYQVLAQQLGAAVGRWLRVWQELLTALCTDWPQLTTLFLPDLRKPCLTGIKGGLSDPHRQGRGVFHLSFQDAAGKAESASPPVRLVYKPRSLAVDAHFQQLLALCNQAAERGTLSLRGLRYAAPPLPGDRFPSFRILRSIDCGDHGWVEFIQAEPCASEQEVASFYIRQGGFLALLHALDGADLHNENVIAHGAHPMLVDLEMLFHPWTGEESAPGAKERAEALLRDSVLRTMLLPGRSWGDRERAGVNLGGLGNGGEQTIPMPVNCWADTGTDKMRMATGAGALLPGDNLPRLGGVVAPVSLHGDALVAGFEAVLRLVMTERDRWGAPGGPLWAFAGDEVRRLVRPTVVYAEILDVLTHPDHQRDPAARAQIIALLTGVPVRPALPPWALQVERIDLEEGDVPMFLSRPGSSLLWDVYGTSSADYLPEPALAPLSRRIGALDETAIGQQVFLIRASLAIAGLSLPRSARETPGPTVGGSMEPSLHGLVVLPPPGDSADGLWAPRWLGERLTRDAVLGAEDIAWIGSMAVSDTVSDLAPLHLDLYDGTAGVALFLGYLGRLCGEDRYLDRAHRAGRALKLGLPLHASGAPLGGFGGLPSQLYALVHLQALLADRSLISGLDAALSRIAAELAKDDRLDVMYGAAGCLLVLLTVYQMTGVERALSLAVACGRHLTARARRDAAGVCWPVPVATRPLLGFAHGAAGIGGALGRLGRKVADHDEFGPEAEGFLELAQAAFRFERASYDQKLGWPDLRQEPVHYPLAWCHGAPGVALGRFPFVDVDAAARAEIADAAERTLAARPLRQHGLCHGQLGNLVFAAEAARLLGRADLGAQVQQQVGDVVRQLHERGPRCTAAFAAASPGLMDGLAGIGLGLLRLAHPDQVPLVLTLAPGPS